MRAEEEEVDQKLEKLESVKDDNTKYYYVMRDLQNINKNNKSSIILKDKDGNIPGSTTDKIEIIEEYFKATQSPHEMKEEFLEIAPCKMRVQFTATEIQGLAKRLNNNKAASPDQLRAEFIKYAPPLHLRTNRPDLQRHCCDGRHSRGSHIRTPTTDPEAWKAKRTTGESMADHPTQYSEKDTDDSTP